MPTPKQSPLEEFKQGLEAIAQQCKGTPAEPIIQRTQDAIASYEAAANEADDLLLKRLEEKRRLRAASTDKFCHSPKEKHGRNHRRRIF